MATYYSTPATAAPHIESGKLIPPLAYSIYPFVVIDRLTLWHDASSPDALKVILVGVVISVPAIHRLYDLLVPRVPRQDGRTDYA